MVDIPQIPNTVRVPIVGVEIDATRAAQGTPVLPQRILVVGSRLAAGTVNAGELMRVSSDGLAELWWGRGSQIKHMFDVLRGYSPQARLIEMWGIALDDDGGAVAATGTITFAGTATEDGQIVFRIAGRRITVDVTNGDAATVVAATSDASDYTDTPTSSAVVLAVQTLTARNAGEAGNDIDVRVDVNVPGITTVVVPMASGATNPDNTATIAATQAQQWTSIIIGHNDDANLDIWEADLLNRDDALVDKPGHGFVGFNGTLVNALIYGAARDSRNSTIGFLATSPSPPWELAAWTAAADEVTTDPALPRNTEGGTVRPDSGFDIKGIAAPAPLSRLVFEEHQQALTTGLTPLEVSDIGAITVLRMVTTSRTDTLGNPSEVFLDITTPRTLQALRFTLKIFLKTRFSQKKLADDPLPEPTPDNLVSPNSVRDAVIEIHDDQWVPEGWVEFAGRALFLEELLVERNSVDVNRVDIQLSPDLVNGLQVIGALVAFRL